MMRILARPVRPVSIHGRVRPASYAAVWLVPAIAGLLLAGPACVKRAPSTAPSAPTWTLVGLPALRTELDDILGKPAFDRSAWGVLIESLDHGEVLFRLDPQKLMMPASNMKIVTLATAAERLGWDYTFETRLVGTAPVVDGVLSGDLVVIGSGDPTINSRGGSPTRVFEAWADQLWAGGLRRVNGRVLGDGRAFGGEMLGRGWSWDYLNAGYAAPASALQFNENTVTFVVWPGAQPGAPARVELRPDGSGLVVAGSIVTAAAGTEPSVSVTRRPLSDRVEVSGTIPVDSREVTRTVAAHDPTGFFARALRGVLVSKGIEVAGDAVAIDRVDPIPDLSGATPLLSHRSAPLSEIATVLMKVSQNLYAETLLRTLGCLREACAAETGQAVAREVLESWRIPSDGYLIADGSGLSRYNYLTADTVVAILRRMYGDPRHRGPFIATLPVAGIDGTIAGRMKGSPAQGNVRAKTGSIANVRALSGYVTTADGEMLVFSILANDFTIPQSAIDEAVDLAAIRLAAFRRR